MKGNRVEPEAGGENGKLALGRFRTRHRIRRRRNGGCGVNSTGERVEIERPRAGGEAGDCGGVNP